MPSCATRRSSSWVAGRASRAVAKNRSRPASQALTIASRCGGTPVDASQRTSPTTALAMCRAMPVRRAFSSAIRPAGSCGATRAFLDFWASLATTHDYTAPAPFWTPGRRLAGVLFDELQHPPPGVVARVLPLLVLAIEEAVGSALVDVHLARHP